MSSSQNYSLFALPVYYFVSVYPHAYAINLIKAATNGKWDNANPGSAAWTATMQRIVPKETYARFQRAEAAHKNGMENFAIFATALVLGTLAQLPNKSMNAAAVVYLISRALYNSAYINIGNGKASYIRSLLWAVGMGICMWVIGVAANKIRVHN
ncbi:hypothetical protein V1517DRAFT_29853 [Lipomyces orientalis]|uniref:Uncharacterized protein n=1 Tax=Lipomyces orientalis TaxID=1233043 RepID=A0ACC3TUS7_9ASCO